MTCKEFFSLLSWRSISHISFRAKGEFKRELFGKKYGHKEWITTCHHLQDGRLLSGGMDSMLCLWDATGVRCDHIKSHEYCDQFLSVSLSFCFSIVHLSRK